MLSHGTEIPAFSLSVVLHWTDISQFIHDTIDASLDCFHFASFMNNAFVNILVQISWFICARISLGYKPGDLLGHNHAHFQHY